MCKFCVSKLCAIKLCVRRRREREATGAGAGAGGGGRDAEPKTRTPHKDVGKTCLFRFFEVRAPFV